MDVACNTHVKHYKSVQHFNKRASIKRKFGRHRGRQRINTATYLNKIQVGDVCGLDREQSPN
jgi:hypothetical protein